MCPAQTRRCEQTEAIMSAVELTPSWVPRRPRLLTASKQARAVQHPCVRASSRWSPDLLYRYVRVSVIFNCISHARTLYKHTRTHRERNTHAHTHTRACAHTHTHVSTRVHARARAHTHTHNPPHTHTHTRTLYTHKHTYTHTHTTPPHPPTHPPQTHTHDTVHHTRGSMTVTGVE